MGVIKKVLAFISSNINYFLLGSMIILIFQIREFPDELREIIRDSVLNKSSTSGDDKSPEKETTTIVKSEALKTKSGFVYFSGNIEKYSVEIKKLYVHNPDYPHEYNNGWLTLISTDIGSKYYMWSQNKVENISKFDGWFIAPNVSKYQHNYTDDYYEVLIPVVERDKD